jgi:hypothetical protein
MRRAAFHSRHRIFGEVALEGTGGILPYKISLRRACFGGIASEGTSRIPPNKTPRSV